MFGARIEESQGLDAKHILAPGSVFDRENGEVYVKEGGWRFALIRVGIAQS